MTHNDRYYVSSPDLAGAFHYVLPLLTRDATVTVTDAENNVHSPKLFKLRTDSGDLSEITITQEDWQYPILVSVEVTG